jgi:hypothetical protein
MNTMKGTVIRTHPHWRCMCGAPVKAFDVAIGDDEITHTCRNCHERLLVVELYRAEAKEASY